MSAYGLVPEVLTDCVLSVNTPLGRGLVLTKVYKMVNALIFVIHMPINMLVLPNFDFDIVLGKNWLNKYQVIIDYPNMELSFT